MYDIAYTYNLKKVKLIKTEARMVLTQGWERGGGRAGGVVPEDSGGTLVPRV